GHTQDGRYESDLKVEMISPLDADYIQYSEAGCINKSTEGSVLFKLQDDKQFYSELRTFLKTNKFIRLNDDGSQSDVTRILADRGRENQERKKRLRATLEEMLLQAEVYALGQHLNITDASILTKFDEACQYLLQNTYTKLGYIKVLQDDPWRELKAVLTVDDIAQMGLSLDGEEGNPQATKEVAQYVDLRSQKDSVILAEIVERFSKRPFGWPDAEVILILGRLAAMGRISFMLSGGTLQVKEAFEPLQNSRRRREVTVIRKRQTDENILKQARNLTKELFSAMGPATEKELFEFYSLHFNLWLHNLKSYKNKTDVSRFPGKKVIEQSILTLERLLNNDDSFDFFKEIIDNKNNTLDLEEDYRDIHEFFTNQLHTWQQLQQALHHFDKNKQALDKDTKAKAALAEMHSIESVNAPYGLLHKVASLVSTVETVNDNILTEKRSHALERVDIKIKQLQAEIEKSGVGTAELSNRLLRPLQLVKTDLETETSISGIYMLQTETTGERLDDSMYELERAIQQAAEEEARRQREAAQAAKAQGNGGDENKQSEPAKPAPQPKAVVEITPSSIFNKVSESVYLETDADIERFIDALKQELKNAVTSNKRVRIR
ncbi:MAG: BREX system P-loop protein BrxC, partial [Methylococcales bacterium]|nr:BREX system P-loop protein BrxC [Methylococcales bacterium]